MIFTSKHQDAFLSLSHDRNHLHWDANYCRRTEFGRPVMYGVAVILKALGVWAQGRGFALLKLKCHFKKPVFVDLEYRLDISEQSNRVSIKVLKGVTVHAQIAFSWVLHDAGKQTLPASHFKPLDEPMLFDERTPPQELSYDWQSSFHSHLEQFFDLRVHQLPSLQLKTLLASSYWVGMIYPGKQALFSAIEVEFEPDHSSNIDDRVQILDIKNSYHEDFRQTQSTGIGPGIKSWTVTSFNRPSPIADSIDSIKKMIPTSQKLSGQNVMITGASRGFGANLARALALQGAQILFVYKTSQVEAAALERDIATVGSSISFQGDLSDAADMNRILDVLKSKKIEIDWLIHNSTPTIFPSKFDDLTVDEFTSFLELSVRMVLIPNQHFLPLVRPNGRVLQISSEFVSRPVEKFSHYLAAKSALEGLNSGLSREYPRLGFYSLRLPRMLTDQTNTVSAQDIQSAASVAAKVTRWMIDPTRAPEFEVVAYSKSEESSP